MAMSPASSITIPKSCRSAKPMVLSTAISPVRSRALIIMALAVTRRIANTTARPMVPISRLTLPHIVAKLALNACSVPVLVGELEFRNWSSSALPMPAALLASSISSTYQPAMPGRPIRSSR
jgi:hypothetical protein